MAIALSVLGKRLKRAREQKGYKQAYVAEMMNLSLYQISRIENGVRSVYIDTLSQWCDLLEISMVDVLNEAEETAYPAHSQMFEEIASNCSKETVVAMLDTCRVIAQVEQRAKEE